MPNKIQLFIILFLALIFLPKIQAIAGNLEDIIWLQGQYDNVIYTESPDEIYLNTDACSFFSGNVGPANAIDWNTKTQFIPPNTPNDGQMFLMQSSIGWTTPATVGWVYSYTGVTNDETITAAEYLIQKGAPYLTQLKTIFDSYYDNQSEGNIPDPDEIYMAFDFSLTNGQMIDPVTGLPKIEIVYDQSRSNEAKEALFKAWKINPYICINSSEDMVPSDSPDAISLANWLLDIPYYQSTSLIMQGNLCLERAFSVRFHEFRNPNIDEIEDELTYLGWNTLTDSFSNSRDGAWYHFNAASQIWLSVFASPIQRQYLIELAPERKLGQNDSSVFNTEPPDNWPEDMEWPPVIYDGYKDVAVMMRALTQRARVVYEVARRLILIQERTKASEVVEEWVQQLALEESVIMSLIFANNEGKLPDNHQELFPELAESFFTYKEMIVKMIGVRDAANNEHLNALGLNNNIVVVTPGSITKSYEFTYDYRYVKYLDEPGSPAGVLKKSRDMDNDAKNAKIGYQLKASDYLSQIDNISNRYDVELMAITGDKNEEPNLENPENGGGLLDQQIDNVLLSTNAIERVIRLMENVHLRIEIERERVATVNNELNERAEMVIRYGNKEAQLTKEIANIRGEMALANGLAQGAATALQSAFTVKWGQGCLAGSVYALNAITQKNLHNKLGKKQAQMVKLNSEKEAQFIYSNQRINDINSQASIKNWFLEFRTLEIDLLDAQIRYGMEINRLAQYYTQIESLIMRRDRSKQRVALKHFADPTFRIEVLNAALEAEKQFQNAQAEVYLTAKSLEYKWPLKPIQSTFTHIFNEIIRARTAKTLIDLMDELSSINLNCENMSGAGRQAFYWNYSLKKDYLNMNHIIDNPDGESLCPRKQFQNWLVELKNNPESIVVKDDIKQRYVSILENHNEIKPKYLAIPFSTVKFNINNGVGSEVKEIRDSDGNKAIIPGRPIFDDRLWDDKIDLVYVNVIGNRIYNHSTLMPVILQYGGTSFLRTREVLVTDDGGYYDYITYDSNWETYQADGGVFAWRSNNYRTQAIDAKLTSLPQDIPRDVIETKNFRELPVAATNWRLLIPVDGVNIHNIDDIEIIIIHKARTRPGGKK
jgi:hypothetical protein